MEDNNSFDFGSVIGAPAEPKPESEKELELIDVIELTDEEPEVEPEPKPEPKPEPVEEPETRLDPEDVEKHSKKVEGVLAESGSMFNIHVDIFESCVNKMEEVKKNARNKWDEFYKIALFIDRHYPECLSWDTLDVMRMAGSTLSYALVEEFLDLPIIATTKRVNLLKQLQNEASRLMLKPNKDNKDITALKVMTETISKITEAVELSNFQPIVIYQTLNDSHLEKKYRQEHNDDYDSDGNFIKELVEED